MKKEILEFAREYLRTDCDWTGTVEKFGYNPYIVWNDNNWIEWHEIMDNYEEYEGG
jgi:hypothetical protein